MLIVALVLAVIGLAALVTAVVTSNELVAWVCIAASVLGVILLIVDAIRERQSRVPEEAVAAPVVASAAIYGSASFTSACQRRRPSSMARSVTTSPRLAPNPLPPDPKRSPPPPRLACGCVMKPS